MEDTNVIADGIKISVVICTYNHEKYIRQAIESVLAQKVKFKYEIIIGDDESKDNTILVISEYKKKYPNMINLILHDKNVGTTINLCDCLMKCRGEYIVLLAGDDYWIDNNKMETQIEWLNNHSDYIAVGHVVNAMDNDGILLGISPHRKLRGKDPTVNLFLKGLYYPLAGLLFKNIFTGKEAYKYVELITSSRLVEDVSMCMLLLNLGKIHIIDKPMSVYRVRTINSNSSETNYNTTRSAFQKFSDHVDLYKANYEFFDIKYDFSRLYALKAVDLILYCIIGNKLNELKYVFDNIPIKSKILLVYYFPKRSISILFNRFSRILKYKWIKDNY